MRLFYLKQILILILQLIKLLLLLQMNKIKLNNHINFLIHLFLIYSYLNY